MTVPSTTRRAGPFTGTGALVAYPFEFKVFAKQDLAVTIADSNGLETDLVLDSTFTVTLNVDQEATPGGTVNYAVGGVATALPSGYTLVVTGDGLEFEQTADLPQGGNFSPVVIENALDRIVMLLQRLWDGVRRSMRLPDTASDNVSTVLPVPTANNFIGWDSNGTALRNVDPNTLATVVAFAAWQSQAFSGDGVTTQFTLSSDPGNVNNLDVVVGAVPQRNNVDFTLSGVVLTFDVAPANGLSIFCRWGQALPEGTSTLQARLASTASASDGTGLIGWLRAAASAVATTLYAWLDWQTISAFEFMTAAQRADVKNRVGSLDVSAACNAAFVAAGAAGKVHFPRGIYKLASSVTATCPFYGEGVSTEFQPTGDFEAFAVQIAHADNRSLGFVRDFIISYENATGASTGAVGLWLNKNGASSATSGCYNVEFSGIYIINPYRGIQQKVTDHGNLWNVSFKNILVLAPREHGIYLDMTADNGSLNVSFECVTVDFGSNPSTAQGAFIRGIANLKFFGTSTSKLGTDGSCFWVMDSTNVDVRLQIESVTCETPDARLVIFQNCSSVELSLTAPTCTFNVTTGSGLAHYVYFDSNCERIIWRAFDNPSETITAGTVYYLNVNNASTASTRLTVADPLLLRSKVYAHAGVIGSTVFPKDGEPVTFNPVLVPASGSFTSVTYNTLNGGKALRIGNLVHFQLILYTDAITVGTASSEIRVSGLPWTAASSTGSTQDGFSSVSIGQSDAWNTNNPSSALVRAGTTAISLYYRATSNGVSAVSTVSHLATGANSNLVRISGTYIAA